MNTCGEFYVHEYRIPFEKFDEPIYIIPFGDIHRSSPMCHEEKWQEFRRWAQHKPRCYFLGMGDYDDLLSSSERKVMAGGLHDSTDQTLEAVYKSFTDRLAKELAFMKGKCIGLISGNHFVVFPNGTTSDQRLCEALDAKFLGCSAFIRLVFECKRGNHHAVVDIWAHHGLGAARLVGGSMNKVQQMAEAAEFDIGLMGHDHKKSVASITRLRLKSGNGITSLSHRKVTLCRTGSFLRGYVSGAKSYVADRMLNPTDLGVIKLELTPHRERFNGTDRVHIDVHAGI